MASETLSVRITANINDFINAMKEMTSALTGATKDMNKLKEVGGKLTSIGKGLTAGVTAPIVGIGVASAKTAMDFEATMNQVSAISGATGKDLNTLTDLAKEMGRTTKFSAAESAEALTYMGMAGWKTQDMVAGLPGILNLAAAGGTDLATTSDIVTDGLTAMGLSASDTNKFVDIMAATCSSANTNIELMGETLKYVGPVAGALGIEMDDLSVAVGLMGNAGIKGSQAGTALRAGLNSLVSPTKECASAMKQYGIELKTNKDGSVDLQGTMENLRSKMGDLNETEQAAALSAIFGTDAMSGWAAIVNASESDFNNLTAAIANADGTAQSMSETMMQGAAGAITEMKSALEGVAITIGERLTPFIEMAADFISNLCAKFQELSPTAQTIIMVIAGIAAAIGPLLIIVGTAITLFASLAAAAATLGVSLGVLLGVPLLIVAAIAALIAIGVALYKNWDTIKAKATEIWNAIKAKVCQLVVSMKNTISATLMAIKAKATEIWNSIKSAASNVWNGIKSTVSNVVNGIKSTVSTGFNAVKSTVTNVWNTIKTAITKPIEAAKSAVSRAMSAIKSAVNVSLKPNLKLPHISVSGKLSLNPPSVPKISVSWYKNGGIMTQPTLFGLAGGEAGPEAILPLDRIQGYFDKAFENVINDGREATTQNATIQIPVILDGKEVARATASYINGQLKKIENRSSRKKGE